MESIMSLSQKILESTEVIETDDVEEKSVEERENIINNFCKLDLLH